MRGDAAIFSENKVWGRPDVRRPDVISLLFLPWHSSVSPLSRGISRENTKPSGDKRQRDKRKLQKIDGVGRQKRRWLVQSQETSSGFGYICSVSKHKPYATKGVIDPSIALKFHVGKRSLFRIKFSQSCSLDANKIQKKRKVWGMKVGFSLQIQSGLNPALLC